jgi:methyl coenzyme M reductase gamma subunit
MRTDQSTLNQVLGKDKGRQQLHVREDEVETSSKRQVETSVGEISKSKSVRMQDVKGGVELNAASSRGMDKSNAIGGGGG